MPEWLTNPTFLLTIGLGAGVAAMAVFVAWRQKGH